MNDNSIVIVILVFMAGNFLCGLKVIAYLSATYARQESRKQIISPIKAKARTYYKNPREIENYLKPPTEMRQSRQGSSLIDMLGILKSKYKIPIYIITPSSKAQTNKDYEFSKEVHNKNSEHLPNPNYNESRKSFSTKKNPRDPKVLFNLLNKELNTRILRMGLNKSLPQGAN